MSRNGKLRRSDTPPKREGPQLKVVRLKGSEKSHCVVLSSALWGCFIHWDATLKRSECCLEDEQVCPGCKAKKPQKWRGYLACWEAARSTFIMELTPEAARTFLDVTAPCGSIRGITVEFRRTQRDNGRLLVELVPYVERKTNLPPEPDIEPILRMLWDWKRSR